MQISVKLDVDKALKIMSRFHKKKMPFAVALGLTMTAKKVAKVGQRMMVWELDRPTPFTIKGGRALINQILKRDGCSHGFTWCLPKLSTCAFRSKVALERQRVRSSQCLAVTLSWTGTSPSLEVKAASSGCWSLTKAQRNIGQALTSMALVSVALERILVRKWIRLSQGRCSLWREVSRGDL